MSGMENQIIKLEELIHKLCGVPYIEDMPLNEIDDEYHVTEFETDLENIDYLLEILEEIIDEIDNPEAEEE